MLLRLLAFICLFLAPLCWADLPPSSISSLASYGETSNFIIANYNLSENERHILTHFSLTVEDFYT